MDTQQDKPHRDGTQDSASPDEQQGGSAASFATTEHFTLQTASAATINESSGRASLFLTTISGTLIALSFIGQATQMGAAFFVFALVLFPSLFFIGLVTFDRTLDTSIQNNVYVRGMNRIRHYYLDNAPQLQRYFILSAHDDQQGAVQSVGLVGAADDYTGGWLALALTTASMVAVINSVLAGVFVGMVFRLGLSLFMTLDANDWPSMLVSAAVGLLLFGVSVFLHFRYQARRWDQMLDSLKVEFPSNAGQQAQVSQVSEA